MDKEVDSVVEFFCMQIIPQLYLELGWAQAATERHLESGTLGPAARAALVQGW